MTSWIWLIDFQGLHSTLGKLNFSTTQTLFFRFHLYSAHKFIIFYDNSKIKLENKCTGEAVTVCISVTRPEHLLKFQLGKETEPETYYYSINLESAIMQLGWRFWSCENVLPKKFRWVELICVVSKWSFNQN